MANRRKLLRKPDGTPEYRTVDDLLRDAAAEGYDRLPGRRKPLDLRGYFASDPAHRMAGKVQFPFMPEFSTGWQQSLKAWHRAQKSSRLMRLFRAWGTIARQESSKGHYLSD